MPVFSHPVYCGRPLLLTYQATAPISLSLKSKHLDHVLCHLVDSNDMRVDYS